jgi:curved DNA-binding protein CbpA
MKTYQYKINQLDSHQIFVFGSNPCGIQGKGSSLFAVKRGWCSSNEKMNNCLSKSRKAWGLVTISYPGKKKSKTLNEIKENIKKLYDYANSNPDKEFLIAYTGKTNYNLNGYTNKQLAECFSSFKIPDNIVFEEEFSTLLSLQGGFEI